MQNVLYSIHWPVGMYEQTFLDFHWPVNIEYSPLIGQNAGDFNAWFTFVRCIVHISVINTYAGSIKQRLIIKRPTGKSLGL